MLRTNLARSVRHLRRRRGWRQSDLAERASVSRQTISRIECGQLGGARIRTIGRELEARDATGDLVVRWEGERLDRPIDADHAAIVGSSVDLLRALGWQTQVEVSFNHFGDRGRVDILARHAARSLLLVVEMKSAIGDSQEMLGRLDVKARLGATLAPAAVVRALVIGDSRAARRHVASLEPMLASFSPRGRQAVAWLRQPIEAAPHGLLWFAKVPRARGTGVTRQSRVRTAHGAG
jgi:transcriptional regulator with XRE-family HTH domain